MTSSTIPSCNVSNTAALLRIALDSQTQTRRVPTIFFEEKVLCRLPFVVILELVKFVSTENAHFRWDELLCYETIDCSSKQDKIEFLTKLLALVSRVIGIRFDIFLSPPMLLKRDISSAHTLLQAVATVSMASAAVMSKAVTAVASTDCATLYNIGEKTRQSFICFQALVRGWFVRSSSKLRARDSEGADNDSCSSRAVYDRVLWIQNKNEESRTDRTQQEYEELMLRKAIVAEDVIQIEGRLKKETEKLTRILRLQSNSRTSTSMVKSYLRQEYPRPRSVPDKNKPQTRTSRFNDQFADCLSDLRATQLRVKHKEQIIMERQRKLKERAQATKIKEAGLKLQEERITELADKIRRQQGQLQMKKMEFERERAMPPPLSDEGACEDQTREKIDLKALKQKLRQRARMLNAREAHIIRMAKELRRREEQLHSSTRFDKTEGTSKSCKRNSEPRAMHAIEEVEEEEEVQPARDEEIKSDTEKTENVPRPNLIKSSRVTESKQHADQHESKSRLEPTKTTISTHQPINHAFTFTFEKDTGLLCDDHCDDVQLQCAMNNLRELL